ncbi:MAG: fibronectin type III domain-containing protein [Dorea sp.]|nr:fibronectin type III domain-containing protein [Dorea sp.]
MKKTKTLLMTLIAALIITAALPALDAEAASKKVGKATLSSAKAAGMNQINVKWKKVKNANGYQLMVAKNKKFSKGKKSYKLTGTSKAITKLSAGTKYYVRVRAYGKSGKKTVYGKWSKVKTVRTVKKHSHKWKGTTTSKRVLVYNMIPFSQATGPNSVGSDNYLRKYRCMCNSCMTNTLYASDNMSLETHLKKVNSPGWFEEIYYERTLCFKCRTDLTDMTEEDLTAHTGDCKSSYFDTWILKNKVYHKSTSYYTTQKITTYKCSVCGMTK